MEIQDIPEKELKREKYWYLLLIQGIIAAVSGIILLFWPEVGLTVAAFVLGIFLIADGIQRLVVSFSFSETGQTRNFVIYLLRGLIQIILGAVIVSHSVGFGRFGAVFLLTAMGILILGGALWDVLRMRDSLAENRGYRFSVLFYIILGGILIALPAFSARFILRILGFFSLAGGGFLIFSTLKWKKSIIR